MEHTPPNQLHSNIYGSKNEASFLGFAAVYILDGPHQRVDNYSFVFGKRNNECNDRRPTFRICLSMSALFFHLGHSDRLELMLDPSQRDIAVMRLNLDDLKELGDVPNELAIFASESHR